MEELEQTPEIVNDMKQGPQWRIRGQKEGEIIEVYESYNGDLYFIAEKNSETGEIFCYARLYSMPQFAEWGYNNIDYLISEYGKYKLWPVKKENWPNINSYEKGLFNEVVKGG